MGLNIGAAELEARFGQAARRRCIAIAEEVVEFIRTSPTTPKETGELATSFYVRETETGAQIDSFAPYWRYVEFGTKEHGRAQAPVRKAMEAVLLRHAA